MDRIATFENMIAQGKDGQLVRFTLGKEYLAADQPVDAVLHLEKCIEFDPQYSAAWNALGKAYQAAGRLADALKAWDQGIAVAQAKGDKQAEREMAVFKRRVEKLLQPDD